MLQLLFTVFFLMITLESAQTQTMKCLSYNIRFDNPKDGENRWDNRKENMRAQIRFLEPDVFGVQEALAHQVKYLDENLEAYTFVGVGRDDGQESGEYSALFYKKTIFNLLQSGTFWLSESPEVPSKAWDAALPRICTYALLEYKNSGKQCWVFNTHFDHVGVQARLNSAKLILQQIQAFNKNKQPVVLMGDFNARPKDAPIQAIKEEMLDSQAAEGVLKFGQEGTFNGFQIDHSSDGRIDYIFLSQGSFKVKKYAVLSELIRQRFISDHFPVFVELEMN
ncbi:MAG: endonuclease/exonuclease/phosphatase family protein [Microscillaceae bacterium]|nr:endonuclease/exonuclease/phosphatase family protein [Microscillaceae bacterium]